MQFFLLIIFIIFIFVFINPLIRFIRAIFFPHQRGNGMQANKDNISYTDPTIHDEKIIKKDEGEYVEFEEIEDKNETDESIKN